MSRSTDRTRGRSLAFSAVAVLAAALGAPLLLSSLKQASRPEVGTRPVVVAAEDLHPAQVLESTDLKVETWPEHMVPADAASEVAPLVGRTVRQDLLTGEPVREYRLADAERGRGLHALIEPGHRAMALRVDEQVGVSGFILPNNIVDVIVAMRPRTGGGEWRARTVLQKARVLAVGAETETRGNKAVSVGTVTLMVTPEEQEQLTMAIAEGKVSLSLRNDVDLALADTPGVSVRDVVGGGEAAPARASRSHGSRRAVASRTPVAPAEPPPAAAPTHDVEVYRGGNAETRSFTAPNGDGS